MERLFHTVRITNFKSLKDVTLSDCKRINLLIGRPNVGKSNILEAIGLFGIGYSKFNKEKSFSQFVRFKDIPELFFDGNTDKPILISTESANGDKEICQVCYLDYENNKNLGRNPNVIYQLEIQQSLNDELCHKSLVNSSLEVEISIESSFRTVNQYKFTPNVSFENQNYPILIPPFGVNLLNCIQARIKLKREIIDIFAEYGLKLVFDMTSHSLKFTKKDIGDEIFLLPFSSIADTLQRIVFFKVAISSNRNSILLFEEPEAHCFPPYIAQITQDIIDSETNQFFIATHSPYVLNDFMEDAETRTQLAIYMADFKDGQTVVYRLTDEELDEVYNYGIDVFFNYERFTAHG